MARGACSPRLPTGVRVGSISRDGKTRIAGADDKIEVGDRLTIIGKSADVENVKDLFCAEGNANVGVVIAGGGETGYHLAATLEGQRFGVVLMDKGGWLKSGRCANALIPARTTDAGDGAVYYDTPVRLVAR